MMKIHGLNRKKFQIIKLFINCVHPFMVHEKQREHPDTDNIEQEIIEGTSYLKIKYHS